MFLAEMTNGLVLRLQMEKVRGEWQGACFPFRQRVGSAVRLAFAPDGTLFCGLTNRGWGGVAPGHGIARVRFTGLAPLEMHTVHLLQDGFEISFTEPLAADCNPTPADIALLQYDYDWWWEYGSPERHTAKVEVTETSLSADRRTLTLRAPLQAAMMARATLSGVRGASGAELLHPEFAYTINQLPEGPATLEHIAKAVAPPPARERGNEGWLFLTWVDATAMFDFQGWSHCEAEPDVADPTRWRLMPGNGALVNATLPPPPPTIETAAASADDAGSAPPGAAASGGGPGGALGDGPGAATDPAHANPPAVAPEGESAPDAAALAPPAAPAPGAPLAAAPEVVPPSDYVTRHRFGDSRVHVGLMLPERGRSALVLQGRYAIELTADEAFGSVILPDGSRLPPALPCWLGAGQWHDIDVIFEAPRFDADGRRTAHARLVRLLVDDILLHENVELTAPSAGWPVAGDAGEAGNTGADGTADTASDASGNEVALGPLVIAGRLGPVAVRDIRVRPAPVAAPADGPPWVPLFNGETLDGWRTGGGATWTVEEGILTGTGATGHLFSPRGDFRDVEVRASLKISDKGNSGLYVRAAFGEGWPEGYEAQVNSTYDDPQRTGSLYALAPIATQLIPASTWFDYVVRVRDEAEGTRLTILVNGIIITDFVDRERRHAQGHIALQQHHEGSIIECRSLEVRGLPPAR
jgi:hypothetical protein